MMMTQEKKSGFFPSMIQLGKIRCKLSRSGFASERVFEIEGESSSIKGVSDRRYCLDNKGQKIGDDVPPAGSSIDGYIVVRILSRSDSEVTASLPSGDVAMFAARDVEEI